MVASGQKRGSLNGATPAQALPAPADGRLSLVTALVDAPDPVELRRALTGAGALSIVLSQASLYTGEVRTEVVRGHHIEVDFHDRLRVEVTAAAADVPRVAAALDAFADGAGAARVVTLATPASRLTAVHPRAVDRGPDVRAICAIWPRQVQDQRRRGGRRALGAAAGGQLDAAGAGARGEAGVRRRPPARPRARRGTRG